jgi:hypothetical protein
MGVKILDIKVNVESMVGEDKLEVYRGIFVEKEDFEKFFSNADEVFKFFDTEVVLGAILDTRNKKAYFITLSEYSSEDQFTKLTVWTAEIE